MTFAAPDPVSSGRPHKVLSVGGAEPSALDQFVGEVGFTIGKDGGEFHIRGLGHVDESGVRFHEKDLEHSGKDVRTWQVSQEAAGEFIAVPTSSF